MRGPIKPVKRATTLRLVRACPNVQPVPPPVNGACSYCSAPRTHAGMFAGRVVALCERHAEIAMRTGGA